MTQAKWDNNRILCVDDELDILETYSTVLAPGDDLYAGILDDQSFGHISPPQISAKNYQLTTASSGEQALALIKSETEKGHSFAAGFFDMRMPGGIDGQETITQARKIDPNLICCVVTAYTDRTIEQLREIFTEERGDELLYFKKPFHSEELQQTAYNMVSSWNRKRREEQNLTHIEKCRTGLNHVLEAIRRLNKIPPHSLHDLLTGLLYHGMAISGSEDGYAAILSPNQEFRMGTGVGKYENSDIHELVKEFRQQHASIEKEMFFFNDYACTIPLTYAGNFLGIAHLDLPGISKEHCRTEILHIFRDHMSPIIMNTLFYEKELWGSAAEERDQLTDVLTIKSLSQRLQQETVRARRHATPLSLLLVQLNKEDLMLIEQNFGITRRDQIIEECAKIIKASLRRYDIIGYNVNPDRDDNLGLPLDGHLFSLILCHTAESNARIFENRLSEHFKNHQFCDKTESTLFRLNFGYGSLPLETTIPEDIAMKTMIEAAINDLNYRKEFA